MPENGHLLIISVDIEAGTYRTAFADLERFRATDRRLNRMKFFRALWVLFHSLFSPFLPEAKPIRSRGHCWSADGFLRLIFEIILEESRINSGAEKSVPLLLSWSIRRSKSRSIHEIPPRARACVGSAHAAAINCLEAHGPCMAALLSSLGTARDRRRPVTEDPRHG